VITARDLESAVPELAPLRATRTRMEYYFTQTPLLMRYVMDVLGTPGSVAIYLDADLFFFGSPSRVLDALGEGSVGIIEHRYPAKLEKKLAKYGKYNVGWVGIRDDENGRACVDWWAMSCLEWCSDTPEDGRYADQGYLDQFPARFGDVVSLTGGGLNLAPWNTSRTRLGSHGGAWKVDGRDPLVFVHFHGIRRRGDWFVTSQLLYRSPMTSALRNGAYVPYLRRLLEWESFVATADNAPVRANAKRGAGLRGLLFRAQRGFVDALSIVSGNAIRASALQASDSTQASETDGIPR
ncbi:MAG: hypothetical protein ABI130_00030, partial [Leifsonia sp.]